MKKPNDHDSQRFAPLLEGVLPDDNRPGTAKEELLALNAKLTAEVAELRGRVGEVENTLKKSEQTLQLFIEHAPAALAMFDTEMRYLSVSRRWLREYRLGERDLVGKSHYEVFPEITPPWREAHRRGLAGEMVRAEADRFERADGPAQWVRWEIRPWRDAGGEIGGIVIFTEDVTDIKESEEALHRYRLLADHSRDIFLCLRRDDGRILQANAAAVSSYGYHTEELLGLSIKELPAPETSGLNAAQLTEADCHGILFETVHCRRDGSTFPVEVSSQGATIGGTRTLISVIRDITMRKGFEAEVMATKLKLEAALASMNDAVFISDAEGRFVEFNDAFATFYKFGNKEDCAKSFTENPEVLEVFLPSGEPVPVAQWAVPRALRGEMVSDAEYTLRRKDTGETWIGSCSFAPIRDKAGVITGAVVTGRDITQSRGAAKALRESEEQFRTLANAIPQMCSIADADGWIFWYNQRWHEYTGTTAEQMQSA